MTDLSDEQKAAIVEAYERGAEWVAALELDPEYGHYSEESLLEAARTMRAELSSLRTKCASQPRGSLKVPSKEEIEKRLATFFVDSQHNERTYDKARAIEWAIAEVQRLNGGE